MVNFLTRAYTPHAVSSKGRFKSVRTNCGRCAPECDKSLEPVSVRCPEFCPYGFDWSLIVLGIRNTSQIERMLLNYTNTEVLCVRVYLLSKCWACSMRNCEPCSHWRSSSWSRLWALDERPELILPPWNYIVLCFKLSVLLTECLIT